MSYKIIKTKHKNYFQITIKGKVSSENADKIATEVLTLVAKHKINKLLVDIREIIGRIGTIETYSMVLNYPQDKLFKSVRTAIIELPENADYFNFYEDAARNLGFPTTVFTDPNEAISWLQEDNN